jgi:hypothetical protein
MGLTNTPSDLLPGTLELLILKALVPGAKHGYGIVEHLRLASDDVLKVDTRPWCWTPPRPWSRAQLGGGLCRPRLCPLPTLMPAADQLFVDRCVEHRTRVLTDTRPDRSRARVPVA